MGAPPSLVVAYPESKAGASGYADLRGLTADLGIRCLLADDVNDHDIVAAIRDVQPLAGFAIGWSGLLHDTVLAVPQLGWYGIHPTRLPEGRGRAPIPWTILKRLHSTASTLFRLTEGIDNGPIIGSVAVSVSEDENASSLYAKHRAAHVALIHSYLGDLLQGTATFRPQDETLATFWERRTPEDGRIDWTAPSDDVACLVRAVTRPFPGAFFDLDGERITVWEAVPTTATHLAPGSVEKTGPSGTLLVGCGEGALKVVEYESAPT